MKLLCFPDRENVPVRFRGFIGLSLAVEAFVVDNRFMTLKRHRNQDIQHLLSDMLRFVTNLSKVPAALQYQSMASFCSKYDSASEFFTKSTEPPGSYVYTPRTFNKSYITPEEVEMEASSIYRWAKSKGAERYTFISSPYTNGVFEKHDSFLNINYSHERLEFKDLISHDFDASVLLRNEADGSSVPSGGLRQTHVARAYTLWDHHSHLYVRKRNNTLYIPALLVTHYGKALSDKTLFRMSETAMIKASNQLLDKLGVQHQGSKMFLGLEQEFFAVSENAYEKRQDLKWLGRVLVGTNPARNQQTCQHYYGKIPRNVELAFDEVEAELLELGIPFKTRHNEVANNQFEIACIFGDAGHTIDQNMLAGEIIKEAFKRQGLVALLHEKPFTEINGSGKHANWNIAYVKPDGSIKNLFKHSEKDSTLDQKIYKLYILIQLMAGLRYHKLYLSAIACPGNEVRLGGHEAPPRIFSVFLGSALSNILDGKEPPVVENLRNLVNALSYDVNQENTDRNRTSPFAYTGRVFEFRALGSTQNASFPMAVIGATMAAEIQEVIKLFDSGKTIDQIIELYTKETKVVRFEGDGYSKEWKEEAKKRGLHVNEKFVDLYKFLDTEQEVFVKVGACSPEENSARAQIYKTNYMDEVLIEVDTLSYVTRRHVIPHAYNYLQTTVAIKGATLDSYTQDIRDKMESVLSAVNQLEKDKSVKQHSLNGCQELREELANVSAKVTTLMAALPNNPNFPDQSQFLDL